MVVVMMITDAAITADAIHASEMVLMTTELSPVMVVVMMIVDILLLMLLKRRTDIEATHRHWSDAQTPDNVFLQTEINFSQNDR